MRTTVAPEEVLGHPIDHRHALFEVTRDNDRISGVADRLFIPSLEGWATSQHLTNDVSAAAPRAVVATVQSRLRSSPGRDSPAVTEVLLGEPLEALDDKDGWQRVRTLGDGYLGWLKSERVTGSPYHAEHVVTVLRGHAYRSPQVQAEVVSRISWGSRLRLEEEVGDWLGVTLPDGRSAFVAAATVGRATEIPEVPTLKAWRGFLGTPYLWGGTTAWGLDCSGFVQLLARMAGGRLPRDSDEQGRVGTPVEEPRPGDLALFPGHVALYLGAEAPGSFGGPDGPDGTDGTNEGLVVHASSNSMRVQVDRLTDVIERAGGFSGFVRWEPADGSPNTTLLG